MSVQGAAQRSRRQEGSVPWPVKPFATVAEKPISTDPSRAKAVPGFGSRDMELQKVTFRYKRGFRQKCICHDDVYR